nr:protein MOR1 [Ipomoea batatas]
MLCYSLNKAGSKALLEEKTLAVQKNLVQYGLTLIHYIRHSVLGFPQEYELVDPVDILTPLEKAFFVHQRSSPTAGVILRTAAGPSLSRRPRLPPSSLPGVLHTVEVAVRFHRIPQVSKVVLPHVFWCEDAVPETAGSGPSEELAADIPQEYELVDPVDILTPLEKSGFREGVYEIMQHACI